PSADVELRTHLDARIAADRDRTGDGNGFSLVARLDEDEPAQDLLRLGERPIGDHWLAAAATHGAGRGDTLEGGGGDEVSAPGELGVIGQRLPVQGPLFLRRQARKGAGLEIDKAEILHGDGSLIASTHALDDRRPADP